MTPSLRLHAARGAAALLFLALAASVTGGLKRFMARRHENRRLALRVAEAEAGVGRKRAQLALAQKSDDLIESEARRQLGLIGEGEIEFRFVSSGGGPAESVEVSERPAS